MEHDEEMADLTSAGDQIDETLSEDSMESTSTAEEFIVLEDELRRRGTGSMEDVIRLRSAVNRLDQNKDAMKDVVAKVVMRRTMFGLDPLGSVKKDQEVWTPARRGLKRKHDKVLRREAIFKEESREKSRSPSPLRDTKEMGRLVIDYLVSEGYREVAEEVCSDSGLPIPLEEIECLNARIVVRKLIIDGNILEAIEKITQLCTDILMNNQELNFTLVLQQIIELIRNKKYEDALLYGRQHFAGMKLTDPQKDRCESAFALLAFESPDESPFNSLLSQSQRNTVATEVNSAVLEYMHKPPAPRLEVLLRTLVWSQIAQGEGRSTDISMYNRQSTFSMAHALFANYGSALTDGKTLSESPSISSDMYLSFDRHL